MHNWKAILIIGLILAGLLLAYGYAQTSDRERYHQEYTFSLAEIERISINGTNAQINLIPIEGNVIKVDISGTLAKNQNPIEAMQQGSQLSISRKDNWFSFFSINLGAFDPEDMINVYINPKYYKDIHINSVSQPVTIKTIKARELSVNNVSGAIELSDIECDTAKLETVSGRIVARGLVTAESTVSSTSGHVALTNYAGNLKGNSISGKFEAAYTSFDDDIHIHSVSGAIVVTLAGANDFHLRTSSVSGNLTNTFGDTLLGNGKNTVVLETVSGQITVQK